MAEEKEQLELSKDEAFAELRNRGRVNLEEPAQVSALDRFFVKNFQKDAESGKKYLQKKYPGAKIFEHGSELFIKLPKEEQYKPLDPSGFPESFKEAAQDIGDIAYDVASGVATAAGTASGGLAAPLTGAATAAGSEALREKIGQLAGLPQEISPEQVGISGALGAAFPAAGQALSKVTKPAYEFATRTVAPKISEYLSGVPSNIYKKYIEKPELIKKVAQDPNLEIDLISDIQKALRPLDKKVSEIGKEQELILSKASTPVNISSVKQSIKEKIAGLQGKIADENIGPNSVEGEALQGLQDFYQKRLTNKVGENLLEKPDLVSPKAAYSLKKSLEDLAEAGTSGADISKVASKSQKEIMSTGIEAQRILGDTLKEQIPGLAETQGKYAKAIAARQTAASFFGDPKKSEQTIRSFGGDSKKYLRAQLSKNLSKEDAMNLVDKIETYQAANLLGTKSAMLPISAQGTTSTTRSLAAAGIGAGLGGYLGRSADEGGAAGSALGYTAGGALGAMLGGPAAQRAYYNALIRSEALGKQATPALRQLYYQQLAPAAKSAWETLQEERNKK